MISQLHRREFIGVSAMAAAGASLPSISLAASPARTLPAFYGDIERRTFNWFWDTANQKNGLVPDRWPTPSFCSIASVTGTKRRAVACPCASTAVNAIIVSKRFI